MNGKVKLPKDVCDALDSLSKYNSNSEIFYRAFQQLWSDEFTVINIIDKGLLMQALVLGYEPEMTAEEQMKERYENRGDYCTYEHFLGYRDGVKDALHLHGIKYDWIKGWGEDDAE